MPTAAILPAFLVIPRSSNRPLSSSWALTGPNLFRTFSIASSSLSASSDLASLTTIRMGGGPRTYPGGVSKWQWKRMQAKKSKQLLKARLSRERQLYEMRKRAELKAAISELERPWETVERAPVLFSVSADEQIKALADRFQRPSGFEMWSERDGPRLFRSPNDLPSARFFPKGAVHSVKPYGVVAGELTDGGEEGEKIMNDDWIAKGSGEMGRGRRTMVLPDSSSLESERSVSVEVANGNTGGNRRSYYSDSELVVSSRKEEYKMASRFGPYGENHGSLGSDLESAVDGSRMNGDNIVGDFGRRGGRNRNWVSGSNSELADASLRMERKVVAGSFGRCSDGRGRGRYRKSYRSHSKSVVTDSSMERDEMANNFGRRGGGSNSELADTSLRMERKEVAGSFGRCSGGRGRDRYQKSYRSHSESVVTDSSMERDEMASNFGRRGGGNRNRTSSESYLDLTVTGSRMQRHEKTVGFNRGRGCRVGNRGSYRSYSEHEKEENKGGFDKRDDRNGIGNMMAGSFDRRGGRGGNQGFYQSYSDLMVAGSRMDRDKIAGIFRKRGGRGGNRGSYRPYSDLAVAGSRMERDKI